ncbi:hypothetical protein P154DRAFT_428023, partial [Amniculicola lignicola CBS 123094]
LLKDYLKQNLTVLINRCVAMSGLENCIAHALKCYSRYGIFKKYRYRNLLWHALNDKVDEILYPDDSPVPSWSWMAYSGGIELLDVPLGQVDWVDYLIFDDECDYALITNALRFKNLAAEADGKRYAVLDSD